MDFVDNLMEDEIDRNTLLAKPTCFIIVGKPVISLFCTHTTFEMVSERMYTHKYFMSEIYIYMGDFVIS